MNGAKITDRNIETMVSTVLRVGVTLAGAVVLCGGVYYLFRHGHEAADYSRFSGAPSIDRTAGAIVKGAIGGRARSIIQMGVLLLIATPIARVAFSLVAFALERDRTYVLITAIVLAVLLYSLVSGSLRG